MDSTDMRTWHCALTILGAGIFYLLITSTPAEAQISNIAMAELYISIQEASKDWLQRAGEISIHLLAVTAVIGFAIGLKDLVLAGNVTLDSIVALLVRYAMLVGLLVWLLQAPQRLALIPMSIKKIGTTISGQDISFSGLISLFADVTNPLVEFTKGLRWTDVGLIICMTFIIFLINCLFFLIATTVLVVEIEAIFIMVGGLFTASFFVIGYFRDSFLGYIKALASVGVKMLMLCLCLGAMRNIMATWPSMISVQIENTESVFNFLMPMACALMGFYMILKAVPQFASSILTGGSSWLDGGALKGAAMAGYALGATVVNTSRSMGQKLIGGASVVSQAAQTYQHTSLAARDTGSTPGESKVAGAKEAVSTVMNGSQAGGPRAAGERIYSDQQRGQQFADVRAGASTNMMSQPASGSVGGFVTMDVSRRNETNAQTPANVANNSINTNAQHNSNSASAQNAPGHHNTTSSPNTAGTVSASSASAVAAASAANTGAVRSAGPYVTPSSQSEYPAASSPPPAPSAQQAKTSQESGAAGDASSADIAWGSFESDRKKDKR